MTSTQDIEELEMFPSTHEIEEIFDEDFGAGNDQNISQESDQLPVNLISTLQPDSYTPASATSVSYRDRRFLTFTLSIPFATIFLVFAILLVYYRPFPPRLKLAVPKAYVHNFNFNNINATLFLKFKNPNHRIHLDLHSARAKLKFGHNFQTSKELLPISLQAHQHKYLEVNFFEKTSEFLPEVNSDARTGVAHKRYIFFLTISTKLRVQLDQISLTFPYAVTLKCLIIVDGHSPPGSVQYSSCN
ncbi:hypothetical protein DCAR_0934875 [Daucus carota subsp. sativus]|uniref:Late embryogenesis abundant protein LEA-2 subgroup domain-containing protein n=1 Tax=Daucus carota subsp. sativus TaxID=79200 RepID=A0A175YGR9_DAUCS|nr:hypothetical protein DCAR_0934875 [Daucus carota subsp. sativus]